MRVTISINDLPEDRIGKHSHKFSAGETCIVFEEKDIMSQSAPPRIFICDYVSEQLESLLSSWGY